MKKIYQNAKRLTMLLLSFMLLSYVHGQIVVTGTVMDGEFGGGLPGANVIVKGSTTGTSTDIDGKYTIKVPDENAVLVFSSIGFASQSIKVGDKRVIDLTLKKDVKQIEEVVKVGYGVQKKTDVTGAVTQIGADDIASRPVIGVDQAMAGKAAGVSVTSNSGSPGSESMVRIRGTGSINNADPLYVMDGVPQNGIPQINPTEIKSISVLKDASSCAIYGSRAANGVVLITTKEGKISKKSKDCENSTSTEISVDAYYGIQTIEKLLDVTNAKDYYRLYKANNPTTKISVPSYVDTIGTGTNWQKQIYRAAPTQRYSIAYESGSEISSIRISANFLKQDGIVKTTDYQSMGFAGKASHNLKKWLSVQETFGFQNSTKHLVSEAASVYSNNPVIAALLMDPTVPVKSSSPVDSGNGLTTNYYNGVFNTAGFNPVRILDINNQKNVNQGFSGSFMVNITPVKNLVFTSLFGANGYMNKYSNYTPMYFQSLSSPKWFSNPSDGATYNMSQSTGWGYTFTNTATYNLDIKDSSDNVIHSFQVMGGSEAYYRFSDALNETGYNMNTALSGSYQHLSMADSIVLDKSSIPSELAMTSLFGRLNYAFKGRYLVTGNLRYDWTSRFVKDKRLGKFPSFSLGWKISDENFFKNNENLKKINECKLRVGWGTIGNQNVTDKDGYETVYPFASNMKVDQYRNYSFNNKLVNGSSVGQTPNASLIWETAKMWNAGIDLALLQNKITMTLDWFNKQTSNMIVSTTLPVIVGAEYGDIVNETAQPTVPVNAGFVKNTGVEASLVYNGSINLKYKTTYEVGGNIAYVKNLVGDVKSETGIYSASLPSPMNSIYPCLTQKGYGIADFYGLQVDGVYKSWDEVNNGAQISGVQLKPGDYKFRDVNGDGKIDAKDYMHIGSPLPKLTYGFFFTGNCGIFDFNLTFQGSYGNKIFNALRYYTDANGVNNYSTRRLNAWSEENSSSSETRLGTDALYNWQYVSSAYIEDGSYLKLKDIVLGATLPESYCKKLKVKKIRVYIQAQNMLTITKYSGYDPEIGQLSGTNSSQKTNTMLGVDLGTYPHAKTFLGGVNFTF